MVLMMLVLVGFLGLTFSISIAPLIEWNNNWKFPEFMQEFEQWAREKEDYAQKLTEVMTNSLSLNDLFISLVVIAFIPAIGEELVFRGMLQNEIFRASRNIHTAIWTSAVIFSAIHFQLYGFIPRMLLGALFGYLYYWSGNLLLPIFAHFFNNAFGVIGIYLSNNNIVDINMEEDPSFPIYIVTINVILTVGLLYYIRKHYREALEPTSDLY
jgi:membrane protease YdiL (CAAX protease family)